VAARYYVKECSKDKLVLAREDVDGPNLIEGDVAFRRMGLYTK
jgi:isocitrate lyase